MLITITLTLNSGYAKYIDCIYDTGVDPGFQVKGDALKKFGPSGGRCENFWGVLCEKLRFYAKISYFFQF